MRRQIALLLAILWMAVFLPALAEEDADNLIANGGFEAIDEFGLPEGWSRDVWPEGESELTVVADGPDGGNCAYVENITENDARFLQEIEVEPNAYYHLSCLVKAEACGTEQNGAGISIRDTFASSAYVYDTAGEWVQLDLYGQTGEKQNRLGVMVRVGGYSSLNTGKAWFDDVRVEKLDSLPAGVEAQNFTAYDYSAASAAKTDDDSEPARNTEAYLLLTCVYVLAVVGFARKKRRPAELGQEKADRGLYWAVLGGALLLRVILALRVRGYNTDITCFEAWSERIFSAGIGKFYSADFFCDYPPGYMVMLWPAALLRRLFGAGYNSAGHILLVKLLPILCDLVCAHIVYRYAREHLGERPALLLGAFYALNPAVFIDSAAWGQIDSVLTLLVVICAIEAVRGRYVVSLPVFALAVLVKPQALLFAPLGLAAVLLNILLATKDADGNGRSRGQEALQALYGLLAALGLMYIVALPFCLGQAEGFLDGLVSPVRWLYNLYTGTMSSYPYFSLNALNFYTLLGLNWEALTTNPSLTLASWVLFGGAYVYATVMYLISRDRKKLYVCGATLMALVCTFGPMIHERYVYPALLLLALAYIVDRDWRLLAAAVALTATLFLNEVLVLQGALSTGNYGHLHDSEQWLNAPLSALNVLITLLLVWTCFELCALRKVRSLGAPTAPAQDKNGIAAKSDPYLHMVRLDYLLMAGITAAYAVLAFVNLGSTTAPQTSWVSSAAGEQIVFDLGEPRAFHMTYYGGICDTTFTVELSNDGETWTEPCWAQYNQGEIFRWIYFAPCDGELKPLYAQTVPTEDGSAYVVYPSSLDRYPFQTARYVRLTAQNSGLVLSEVAFLDTEDAPLPIRALKRSGASELVAETAERDPMRLMDEQNIVPAHPTYYNSSYFDEIYHARTAYEHLHRIEAYEWTHPPLGKVLMMFGVQIFGMTPFGWRFMGALMGVLMLPAMYLLVKQLTKRTDLSAIATFLMAVDSMHFTQTRIATIDSYAVFFIMVMYLFMFRYSQMSWNRQHFWRTLVPLGLSGLFMGFAIATKWIGLYAAVGLAVIFFYTLWLRVREYPGRDGGFALTAVSFVAAWGFLIGALFCLAMGAELADILNSLSMLPERLAGLSGGAWYLAMLICLLLAAACAAFFLYQVQRRTDYQREFWRNLTTTIGFCVIMFVLVPMMIYYFSYYWQLRPEAGGLNLTRVIALQRQMLGYHAGLGGDTHFFRSPWYQWPVIAWPMWYYSGDAFQPAGVISSISCMGNPAVWWTGLLAFVLVCLRLSWLRKAPKAYLLVVIGFASQFLPWVLVPRSTFIYHYFASVPFIIIAIALILNEVRQRSVKEFRAAAIVLCAAALVLFIGFYPLESGLPVRRSYAMLLRWFNWYNF